MTIASVRADHYRIPLPVALSDSTHGTMEAFELVTVRLRDADGAEGLGYTYTVGAGGGAIWQQLWWQVHYVGRGGLAVHAISAIDTALWDLMARRRGLPLWRLLGGHDPRVPAYAGGIDLQFTLDQLLRQTVDKLAKGFRAIKMKVGRERLSEDVARVQAMRELLGPDTPLMVDANMRWSADQAIRAARALAAYDVYWLEEPTVPEDVPGHVRIVQGGGLPVAAGENLRTLAEFRALIGAGGVTFPEPDLSNCGGVSIWLKVARLAEAANLPVTSHGVHDLHVHLLAAVPNASYLEVHGFGLERFMAEPLRIEDGCAIAPERPGHGVELDWAALEALRV
jgi:L-alanine-DL-glutamate epimerase-like enolase superfamily enzyme